MKYLLDTDITSYFLRGKFNLADIFNSKGVSNLRLSIITIAELEVAAYKNPHSVINLARIEELSTNLGVIYDDRKTWKIFSEIKAKILKSGKTVGDFDLLQSSISLQHNLIVVTNNTDHYKDIVPFENWTIA